LLLPLMHGNSSRACKGLSPLRRVKLASPVNTSGLCSLVSRDSVSLMREKTTSPVNTRELCSLY
jgi:hypothetical protein